MSQMSFLLWVVLGCKFRGVQGSFGGSGSFGEVLGKFRGSFGEVSGKFRESFGEVSGKFRGSFRGSFGEFRGGQGEARGSYVGFRGTQTSFPTRNPGDLPNALGHNFNQIRGNSERVRGKVAKSTRNMVFMHRAVLLGFFAAAGRC